MLMVVKLLVNPDAGARIDSVVREAAILALTEQRTVEFLFNGTPVTIVPEKIVGMFCREWGDARVAQGKPL